MKAIRTVILITSLMLLGACGPVINILEVDVRLPAAKPLTLPGKELAVFIPQYDSVSITDSILLAKFAQSLAGELALQAHLPSASVPLFNHYTGDQVLGTLDQPDYAYRLAMETESDMIFMVDSVFIGGFDTRNIAGSFGNYKKQFLIVPFHAVVRIFDAHQFVFQEYLSLSDTLAWEVWVPDDAKAVSIPESAFEDIQKAAVILGQRTARSFSDQWETQDRVIFHYSKKDWNRAYDHALAFEWDKAMQIWLRMVEGDNAKEVACAAFNIALACEMQGYFDLGEEWLELSAKTFSMPETEYYLELLQERKKNAASILIEKEPF